MPSVLLLAGLIIPAELSIAPAGAVISPGRIGILLLLFPALSAFSSKDRRVLVSDLLVGATVASMLSAAIVVSGISVLWSAPGGEGLEFAGGYLISRAFIFGPAALHGFLRVLRVFAVIVIFLALADTLSARMFLHDTISALLGVKPQTTPVFRLNMVSAAATFEHPILFGSFCAIFATISLYCEATTLRRFVFAAIAFVGSAISLTSVALMSFALGLSIYTYDQLMWRYPWRWALAIGALTIFICCVAIVTNAPLGWILAHLTFEPESGYFRYMIWDAALVYIEQAPLFGYAYNLVNNDVIDHSVDTVWLVIALHYGVPATLFLFLANVTSFLPAKFSSGGTDRQFERRVAGFTAVLVLFMFIGLTVHFWNFMWIFWGLCIGIRASLRELQMVPRRRELQSSAFGAAEVRYS